MRTERAILFAKVEGRVVTERSYEDELFEENMKLRRIIRVLIFLLIAAFIAVTCLLAERV
jgi:hypothetical protein